MATSAETEPVTEDVTWKTLMTVGSASDTQSRTFLGYTDLFTRVGSMADNTYIKNGETQQIHSLYHHDSETYLHLMTTTELDGDLTLHVDGHRFSLAAATKADLSGELLHRYIFNRGRLTLTSGTQVIVKIK